MRISICLSLGVLLFVGCGPASSKSGNSGGGTGSAGGTGTGSNGSGGGSGKGGGTGSAGGGGTVDMGPPGGSTPILTMCPAASEPPLASGTCAVTAGSAARLITGTILTPGQIYRGGQVLVDTTGKISCVGCDCSAMGAGATTIDCPTGVVSPGLINPHDHITYTQDSPSPDTGERYEQRHDWREGLRGHTKITVPGGATAAQIEWGELRFLMGGATSTVGSGGEPGLVRNLDRAADSATLGHSKYVDFDTFPLDDSSGIQLTSGCAYGSTEETEAEAASYPAYEPHIGEGVDVVARNEFLCVSQANADDLMIGTSSFIHAAALEAVDYQAMAGAQTKLIWSPRSNIRLYGNTAPVTVAARMGVTIALGSDWLASGSMNLLRELACADSFNQTYLDNFFNDQALWLMVTDHAATVAGVDDVLGSLTVGKFGDIAIFDGTTNKDHRAVLSAQPQDVLLVERAGTPLYGDADAITALGGTTCDAVSVCGANKAVCVQSEVAMTYSALQTAANDYAAFFCGTPTGEPTCVPSRPEAVNGSTIYTGVTSTSDSDGDGIPDASDDCPHVFNPIRPVDNGKQADADGDGTGDACDSCPLIANSSC